MIDLDPAKRMARAAARAKRRGLNPVRAGEALTRHALNTIVFPRGAVVSGFWPLAEEIDIRPLMHALHAKGHSIALPITPRRGQPLTFARWRPGDVLLPEAFGTVRPTGERLTPDVLLIPLLAFDGQGRRLGYGGGFYDRTLAGLPGSARIGCAFAEQQVDTVPVGPYDMQMDMVATDRGVIRFGG